MEAEKRGGKLREQCGGTSGKSRLINLKTETIGKLEVEDLMKTISKELLIGRAFLSGSHQSASRFAPFRGLRRDAGSAWTAGVGRKVVLKCKACRM